MFFLLHVLSALEETFKIKLSAVLKRFQYDISLKRTVLFT